MRVPGEEGVEILTVNDADGDSKLAAPPHVLGPCILIIIIMIMWGLPVGGPREGQSTY